MCLESNLLDKIEMRGLFLSPSPSLVGFKIKNGLSPAAAGTFHYEATEAAEVYATGDKPPIKNIIITFLIIMIK